MTDRAGVERPPSRIDAVAETVALIGGVLLIAVATMVVVSVTLRSDLVGAAGVPGDFELVQMATAVAAFALPFKLNIVFAIAVAVALSLLLEWSASPDRRGAT